MSESEIQMDNFSYEPVLLARNCENSIPKDSSFATSLHFLRLLPKGKLQSVVDAVKNGEYDGKQSLTIQDRRKDRTLIMTANELVTYLEIIENEEKESIKERDQYSEIFTQDDNFADQNPQYPSCDIIPVSSELHSMTSRVEEMSENSVLPRPQSPQLVTKYFYQRMTVLLISFMLIGLDLPDNLSFGWKEITWELQKLDDKWTIIYQSIQLSFCFIFSIVAGVALQRSNKSILYSSLLFMLGIILKKVDIIGKLFPSIFFLPNSIYGPIIYCIGSALVGSASGIVSVVVPVFLAQISPLPIRSKVMVGIPTAIAFGIFVSNILTLLSLKINGLFRILSGLIEIVLNLSQLIYTLSTPPNPRWLIENGRIGNARQVLAQLYGDEDWARYECNRMQNSVMLESNYENKFSILFSKPIQKALICALLLQCCQQLAGIYAIIYFKTPTPFWWDWKVNQNETVDPTIKTVTLIFDFISPACFLISHILLCLFLIGRLRNKTIFLLSTIGTVIGLLIISGDYLITGTMVYMDMGVWISYIGYLCYFVFSSLGLTSLPWICNAEIYPNCAGVTITSAAFWFSNIISVLIYYFLFDILLSYTYIIFAVLAFSLAGTYLRISKTGSFEEAE